MLFCHIRSSLSALRGIVPTRSLTLARVRLGSLVLMLCAASGLFGGGGAAQTGGAHSPSAKPVASRRPMSLVDIAELPRVVDPQLSPDGKTVVYMLSQADWNAGRPIYHLWRQDTAGGAPVRLTTGAGETPGSTRWSPDGSSVVFVRAGQLMQLTFGGGTREPRALSKHATSVSSPGWSPDGAFLYFLAADSPGADERDRERRKDDIYAV